MASFRNKVLGMFLGVAIGDARGLATEGWSRDSIRNKYPNGVPGYEPIARADGKSGITSDDWQLTQAVAKGMMTVNVAGEQTPLLLSAQKLAHIEAFKESTDGWGGTTREAVRAMCNGVPYFQSGISGSNRGKGNACCMKIAPVAAYVVARINQNPAWSIDDSDSYFAFMKKVCEFSMRLSLMTHNTVMAVQSAIVQQTALSYCLKETKSDWGDGTEFDEDEFIWLVTKAAQFAEEITLASQQNKVDTQTDLYSRLMKLHNYPTYTEDQIIAEFGGLGCYIGDSLPSVYMFFLKNHANIQSMYDIINAGGDTDSNASMLGALLGALHGTGVFPNDLIAGLVGYKDVLKFANDFCNRFNIN